MNHTRGIPRDVKEIIAQDSRVPSLQPVSMSNPLSKFQSLQIGDMAETRAQRQRQQQRADATTRSRGRGRARAGLSSQPPRIISPTLGHSGMQYFTHRLSPDSSLRANEGLGSDFFVDRLRRYETGDRMYYAFQLKKPVSVRIHDPANGINRVECTCGEQTPCVHLYWLFDGLRAVFRNQTTAGPRDISDGAMITDEISELYNLIGENMVNLPKELNTTRGSEPSSDTDEDAEEEEEEEEEYDVEKEEEPSISPEAEVRASLSIDMLSIFDSEKLPDEYASELPEVSVDAAFEDILIPGNLAATIYGLAVREEAFYMHLRKLINGNICAEHYLRKQRRRVQWAISKLDQPSDDPSIKVHVCGETLRQIVREVSLDREARTLKGPLGLRTLATAAQFLVYILESVCEHNKNINPSPGADANLYTYLISDPSPSEEGDFVIDQLRKLPQNEWRHLLERLTEVAEYVRNNASEGRYRSVRYAEKIEGMVRDYTSSVFEPSSSSHQRPISNYDRESQRRRYH